MLRRISPIHREGSVSPEQQELMCSLQEAQTALSQAYLTFNDAIDPELVESCIFEIRSLQSRINYLLRRMKAEDAAAAAWEEGPHRWI